MKFELFWEHVCHYAMCVIILGVCGMLVPAMVLMIGGGHVIVSNFGAPLFGFDEGVAKVMYGALTFIIFTLVTKAWMIEGCIDEWIKLNRMHSHTVDRLKNGPAYFRPRVAS